MTRCGDNWQALGGAHVTALRTDGVIVSERRDSDLPDSFEDRTMEGERICRTGSLGLSGTVALYPARCGKWTSEISVGTGEEMPAFTETAVMYVQEVVNHLEEVLGQPAVAYTPRVPPWS
jgi:hypothetical protein